MSEWEAEKRDLGKFATRSFHNSDSRSSPGLTVWLFILTWHQQAFWMRHTELVYRYFTSIGCSNLGKPCTFGNKQQSILSMSLCGQLRCWKIVIWGNNKAQFCRRCLAGGPDLEKVVFFKKWAMVNIVDVALQAALTLKNENCVEINKDYFCRCCPAGGPDLEKSVFFENRRRLLLSMLPCGRPRPWKIVVFWK